SPLGHSARRCRPHASARSCVALAGPRCAIPWRPLENSVTRGFLATKIAPRERGRLPLFSHSRRCRRRVPYVSRRCVRLGTCASAERRLGPCRADARAHLRRRRTRNRLRSHCAPAGYVKWNPKLGHPDPEDTIGEIDRKPIPEGFSSELLGGGN